MVLLVEGATADGLVPALCEVKVVLSDQQPHLSTALWEDDKYRYIFCFDTEELDLTWVELRDQLRFASRYNPGGQFMPVKAERLQPFNGADFVHDLWQGEASLFTGVRGEAQYGEIPLKGFLESSHSPGVTLMNVPG